MTLIIYSFLLLMEQQKVIRQGASLQCISQSVEEKHMLPLYPDNADDMAPLDSTEGLQETTGFLCNYNAYVGLTINADKTK